MSISLENLKIQNELLHLHHSSMISKENKNILIVLAGATAVGKTSVSIELAKHFQADVFSADSRQIYREMKIGTAKPGPEEQDGIIHHFIDDISITEEFNVKKYELRLIKALNNHYKKNNVAILAGGTGLYIQAALYGMDHIPDIPRAVTRQTENDMSVSGLDTLVSELVEKDPDIIDQIDLNNPRRVVRALSVVRHTGQAFSTFRKGLITDRDFSPIKIYLERDRKELYERIDARVDKMLEDGLLEEVISLSEYHHLPSLQTVGYQEIVSFLKNEVDFYEAIRLIKRNSRRYAKRQITWFKNQDTFQKFHPEDVDNIIDYIHNIMKTHQSGN